MRINKYNISVQERRERILFVNTSFFSLFFVGNPAISHLWSQRHHPLFYNPYDECIFCFPLNDSAINLGNFIPHKKQNGH